MKRILILGENGLSGSALKRESINHPDLEFSFANRNSADLRNKTQVASLLKATRPNWVINTSATVGGIFFNLNRPADLFYDNILINTFVIDECYKAGVEKLLCFSSICAFPDNIGTLTEDKMHDGPIFSGNIPYGMTKRAVDIQITAYKKQYGIKNYASMIPENLYGPNDLYNLDNAHIIPSLLHKIYLAKKNNTEFKVWGTGRSERQFIFIDDVAKILMQIIKLDDIPQRVIISGNETHSIRQVVETLCKVADYPFNDVVWETDKPNGQLKRPTDISLLKNLVGEFKYTSLEDGLRISYNWFEQNYPNVRL